MNQIKREKRLKQKLFQEVDPQIKHMILSIADQKPFDKIFEIAQEITDDLDAKKENVELNKTSIKATINNSKSSHPNKSKSVSFND